MDSFLTPSTVFKVEISIKRSRFIASCAPVIGKKQAKAHIVERHNACPDANHHCWAMIAGAPWDEYQHDQSDDGEPRGSAGKPMLVVLRHAEVGQIVVVVSRVFGGTKLGVGGLVRAYSQATLAVLEAAQTERVHIRVTYDVIAPYPLFASIEHYLPLMNCVIQRKHFAASVELTILVPVGKEHQFESYLTETGSGSIEFSKRDG